MATVWGQSGRYVTNEAASKKRQFILLAMVVLTVLGACEGFLLSLYFHPANFPHVLKSLLVCLIGLSLVLLYRFADRKLKSLDKAQLNYERGADGEHTIARELAKFPSQFTVINDLKTPYGNLDHVVIGPTGVFVLDAKNWRGVVTSDGNGGLSINGRPTDKQEIRNFVTRMMSIRDRIRSLALGVDPFYQAVFVFPSARVEAKWGTTGNVHCIRDDQLRAYIVEKDFGRKLCLEETARLTQAFLAVARMEPNFAALENTVANLAPVQG